MRSDRLGLFIIRAWLEGDSPLSLRIEIRLTSDVAYGFQRHLAFNEVDGACEAVREWLAEILASQEPHGGDPPPVESRASP